MSAIAEHRAGRRARSAGGKRGARDRRRPFAGGVAWIVVVGALLAGVVAVNVAVLRLNVELDRLGRERAELKADVASGRAQLSTASANSRIEGEAAARLGLMPADPSLTTYVRIAPEAR